MVKLATKTISKRFMRSEGRAGDAIKAAKLSPRDKGKGGALIRKDHTTYKKASEKYCIEPIAFKIKRAFTFFCHLCKKSMD
jgi:hypothetical protein